MVTGFTYREKGKGVTATQYMSQNALFYESSKDGITAAGTNLATATPLTNSVNRVTTVASGTGVSLPPAGPGLSVTVIHAAVTNALLVYGSGSDTINGSASYSIAAASAGVGVVVTFWSTATGVWHAQKSA